VLSVRRLRLLIISYLFPPMGGIGVQRAISLSKYLPRQGFSVHVLSAANAGGPVRDEALVEHIPASVTVHRAFTPEIPFALRHRLWSLFRSKNGGRAGGATKGSTSKSLLSRVAQRVLCPEPEVLWTPIALRAARRIIKKYAINAVMVTAPPFSAFMIGARLKRENPRLTFIADFRDEWLTFYINHNEFQNNPHARKRASEIEAETVDAADLVVAVNEFSLKEIRDRYPSQTPSKFQCVPNGFEPAAFAEFTRRKIDDGILRITHVGTLHGTATAQYFMKAFSSLPEQVKSRVKLRFVGRIIETEHRWLAEQSPNIELVGFVPQREAIRQMEDADILLMTMTDNLSMPGKFYEYLATGKPILALASPASVVSRTMEETHAGWCFDPHDTEGIRGLILEARTALSAWTPSQAAASYARPNLVELYGSLIIEAASATRITG